MICFVYTIVCHQLEKNEDDLHMNMNVYFPNKDAFNILK